MFKSGRQIFGLCGETQPQGESSVEDLRLAVALVLVSAAKTDNEFGESEYQMISQAIETKLKLSTSAVHKLLSEAEESDITLDQAAGEICANFTSSEREQILALAWGVFHADNIAEVEESAFAVALRTKLKLSIEQSLRARKLAEGVFVDGFKEFVEASEEVKDFVDKWKKHQEDRNS